MMLRIHLHAVLKKGYFYRRRYDHVTRITEALSTYLEKKAPFFFVASQMNVSSLISAKAWSGFSCVFITMGPFTRSAHAEDA